LYFYSTNTYRARSLYNPGPSIDDWLSNVWNYWYNCDMSKKSLPYLNAGLFFAAGCIWVVVPGAVKFIATPLFFIAAIFNVIAARQSKK
jgi:hypothetical protein